MPATSKIGLLLTIVSFFYFSLVICQVFLDWKRIQQQREWIRAHLRGYEHFLVVAQCNMLFQLASLLLHIFGHFIAKLIPLRDYVYTCLAFPFSSSTVFSFWTLWIVLGRERVFPETLDTLYPYWVLHGFHTFSPVVNILLLYLINHKFSDNPSRFTIAFLATYFVCSIYLYLTTGGFSIAYLSRSSRIETTLYYMGFVLLNHVLYVAGKLFGECIHQEEDILAAIGPLLSLSPPSSRTPTPISHLPPIIIPKSSPSTSSVATQLKSAGTRMRDKKAN